MTGIWVLLGALLLACGCSEDAPTIEVDVVPFGGEESLQVDALLLAAGQKEPQPAGVGDVYRRLDRFVVNLPAGFVGEVLIRVAGLDAHRCALTQGEVQKAISGAGRTHASVDLHPMGLVGCRVVVQRSEGAGESRVVSDQSNPSGAPFIDCPGRCEAPGLPPATALTLKALPSADSYFLGWTGSCTGQGPCSLVSGSGVQRIIAAFAARGICSPDGFCWERPLPQGNNLFKVWGTSGQDFWIVGDYGTVLHQSGALFTAVPSGTTAQLRAVWGSGRDDVWAAGLNTVVRWDGVRFQDAGGAALKDIYVQALWGLPAPRNPFSMAPDHPKVLWAAGIEAPQASIWRGQILRFQDGAWMRQDLPVATPLYGLWGSREDDVWAVGVDVDQQGPHSVILRWDGRIWSVAYWAVSSAARGSMRRRRGRRE